MSLIFLVSAYDDEPLLSIPDENASVYKYYTYKNFKKFVCSKSVFFSRISNWDDPSEGIISPDTFYDIFKSHVINYDLSEEKKKDNGDYEQHCQYYKILTRHSYACCFHINEQESHYMWDVFADGKCEIAIKSSIEKIRKTFEQDTNNQFIIGSVIYDTSQLTDDFKENLEENNYRLFYKKAKYKEEKEFRAIVFRPGPYDRIEDLYSNYAKQHPGYPTFKIYDLEEGKKAGIDSKNGEKICIDLEYLIDEVILRPGAKSDLEPKVRRLINWNICNPASIIIRQSNL